MWKWKSHWWLGGKKLKKVAMSWPEIDTALKLRLANKSGQRAASGLQVRTSGWEQEQEQEQDDTENQTKCSST